MYLKAIELHGFKSFPEKTRIAFEPGMSAVVGPNGSGKSNISDGIRWVLGETRSSQLRGSGKMEDIIFGGTQKRSPMGFASVSLILDNSERSFDLDKDEIAVTRKYYRGGDSEYYINGARVRLRDIYELFLDTGLGKNGYSIVGQGKISEIVTAKPEGRREIFEEASGIAKFRYKKNEAEKSLSGAQDNITRLSDILITLESRVEPLEKDSKKAKEFIALSQEKKGMEISLWLGTIDRSKALMGEQQRKKEILTEDYDAVQRQLVQSEEYLEKRYLEANALLTKNDENVALMRDIQQEISERASQKAVLESQIAYNTQQINALQIEIENFDEQSNASGGQRQAAEQELSLLLSQIEEEKQNQEKIEGQIDELSEKLRQADGEKGRLIGEINSNQRDLQDEKIQLHGLFTQEVSLNESLEKALEEKEKAAGYSSQVQGQVADLEEFISGAQEQITSHQNIKNGLAMKQGAVNNRLLQAAEALRANGAKQTEISGKIRLLSELENNMDGFAQSVKAVLTQGKNGALGGILGSVAQLISVEKGYETAVEIALGYALQNVVVENEISAKRAIEFLKNNRGGRATFLPLDTIKPSHFSEKLPPDAKTADSVITCEGRYKNIISNLLGRTIISQDLNSASTLAKSLGYRYRIVTLDGQQINSGGSFTGGSVSKSAGLFTRKGEIEELKIQLQNLKNQLPEIEKSQGEVQNSLDLLNSQIAGCQAEIAQLNEDRINAELEKAKQEQLLKQYQSAYTIQSGIAENAVSALKSIEEKRGEISGKITACEEKITLLDEKLSGMGLEGDDFVGEQNRLTKELQEIKLKAVSLDGRVQLQKSLLSQIDLLRQSQQLRRDKMQADMDFARGDTAEKEGQIALLLDQTALAKEEIRAKEEENKGFIALRMEIEGERNQINSSNKRLSMDKEELSRKLAQISERIDAMESSYDEIITKLWEEYELTVQTARPFLIEVADEGQMKRDLSAVKSAIKRLGNVNLGAIEEYKEVFEKYTFLKGQLSDLEQSKNQLTKLITSLNGEMKTLFNQSFEIINNKFGTIFGELFGGGSGKLVLTNQEDVLSSGIDIVVSPPGKVIKSLMALSGGEQSLVAIALYFAILEHNPSPFCVLDEIEAALDDVNVVRYANYLHRISQHTQFIVITHRRGTMEAADVLYGVTMQEDGISKLLKLDASNLSASLIN
ncbi:MAG: chromosome segregation protein SMC [Oscillospiraceae bacterium]